MKVLKAFIKPFEAPQRSVKIKTYLNFFTLSGIGTLRVNISAKKNCLFWVWPMGTPFLHKLGQNMIIFRFQQISFRTNRFQLKFLILIESPDIFNYKTAKKIKVGVVLGQNLDQIRSNVVKKVKKQALVFFIIYMEIPFKAKSSGCTNT